MLENKIMCLTAGSALVSLRLVLSSRMQYFVGELSTIREIADLRIRVERLEKEQRGQLPQ